MKGTRINWVGHVLLPLGLAAMELCWLYPWSLLFGLWVRPEAGSALLEAPSVLGLLLLGYLEMRTARRLRWRLVSIRALLVATGLSAVLIAVSIDYGGSAPGVGAWPAGLSEVLARLSAHSTAPALAFGFGLGLWWRAIGHGRGPVGFDDLERAFRVGTIALVGLLLLGTLVPPASADPFQARLGGYVVGYFFASLTSLSLARLEAVRERSRSRERGAVAFSRHWLAVMLSVVLAVLLGALSLAQLLSFDLITTGAAPALRLLGAIAELLLFAIALAMGLLLEALIDLVRFVLHPGAGTLPPPPGLPSAREIPQVGAPHGLPAEVVLALQGIAVVLLAALVLLGLGRAVYWWLSWERDTEVVEERDWVWSWGSLRSVLQAWLEQVRQRLVARRLAPTPGDAHSEVTRALEAPAILTVREVYRRLLGLGAAAGLTRAPAATPYEHLPRLQGRLGADEDVAHITELYVAARYGPEAPHDDEVRDVQACWERVLAAQPRGENAPRGPGQGTPEPE